MEYMETTMKNNNNSGNDSTPKMNKKDAAK